jgi:hypothetical protein
MTKEYILDLIKRHTPEDVADILIATWNEGRLSEEREEREAWDTYFSTVRNSLISSGWDRLDCAQEADAMLAERRKRFGK